MDNWQDIMLDEQGDIIFTDDGDLALAEGGAEVAQDVRTEAILSPGDCFWAPEFGRGIGEALKGPDTGDIAARLRAAALNDPRIDAASIESGQAPGGGYELSFRLLNGESVGLRLNEGTIV